MEIFVNDIKIPFNGSINLRFFNPMFNNIGGHSFPVSFDPRIPIVKKAFGFPGQIDCNWPTSATARIKTPLIDVIGEWEITEASETNIEAYFKASSGHFYSLVGDRLLTSLKLGGVQYPAGEYGTAEEVLGIMDASMEASYPDDEYTAFTAYMPNAYGSTTEDKYKIVNDVTWDGDGNPTFVVPVEQRWNNTIYLFAGTVIDYIFKETGYRINRSVFRTDPELQKLVIFNCYNRDSSNAFDYTKLVPKVKITDFLKAFTNRFDIGFFINESNKSVDIIFFDDVIQKGVKEVKTRFTSKPVTDNRRVTGIQFPLNAPDSWALHEVGSYSEISAAIHPAVNKYSDLPIGALEYNHIFFVKSESAFYKIVYEDSTYKAKRVCMNLFPYNPGSGGEDMEQYSGIPGMYTIIKAITGTTSVWNPGTEQYDELPYSTDFHAAAPRCDLQVADKNINNDFPLMLVFARGINEGYVVPDDNTPDHLYYPLGNNDIYDGLGAAIAGAALALNWNEDNGVIKYSWENRINWELNGKKVVKGNLSTDDLRELVDYTQVVRIEKNNYLVKSQDVELSGEFIKVEDTELLRL
jgi:hypothetical protein